MMLPSSIAFPSSTDNGVALNHSLLCLFGDLDKHVLSDSAVTVSLYDTTGSDSIISILANVSLKSLRQISICNSPEAAIMCYWVSLSCLIITRGSDFESFYRP